MFAYDKKINCLVGQEVRVQLLETVQVLQVGQVIQVVQGPLVDQGVLADRVRQQMLVRLIVPAVLK